MSKIQLKTALLEALELSASLNEKKITKELKQLINRNFVSRNTKRETRKVLKNAGLKVSEEITDTEEGVTFTKWQPSEETKKKELATSIKKMNVVDDTEDVHDIEKLIQLAPQSLIDTFGSIEKLKEFSKSIGLKSDQTLEALDFVNSFKEEAKKLL